MLNTIKTIIGLTDNSKDSLLKALMSQAEDFMKNYCHIANIPHDLENTLVQIVVIKYNLLGTEGIESEAYSGVDFNYASTLPDYIYSQLNSFRKVRTI